MSQGVVRLLIVDDDTLDAERVVRALRRFETPVDCVHAMDERELFARLDEHPFDCILLDYILPGVTAKELLPRLAATHPHVPVVVLTGQGDERVAVEVMKAGASDYLPKHDLGPDRLARAIHHARSLSRAKPEVERADAALKDMLAVVSHDLRGPLHNLRLGLDLLSGVEPRLWHSLQENVGLLQRLVDDLLDLARLHHGKFELARSSIDLGFLASSIIEAFLPQARAKDITLSFKHDEGARVLADGHRIGQVLGNLVSNALKFTTSGGHVAVGIAVQGDQVVTTIEDTGSGIKADDVSRVFTRFWSNDPKKAGLGLGLYIAKAVIDAHGGTISVDSRAGKGTTFTVRLARDG